MELNDINKEFGAKIKEIREKYGLSQKEFGRLVGIHEQQISRYERGAALPRSEIRRKILSYEPVEEDAFLKAAEAEPEWQPIRLSERRSPENLERRNFINKVITILESGNRKVITALISNVEAFLEAVGGTNGPMFDEGD